MAVETSDHPAGADFGNWDNTEYVNGCFYPNLELGTDLNYSDIEELFDVSTSAEERGKYSSASFMCGTYLDFMIPMFYK